MAHDLSPRLADIVDALPLSPGMRVIEIGCGPGAAARAVVRRVGDGQVLAIDRSARAIRQAMAASAREIASGRLSFRHVAVEDLSLEPNEAPFDLAFAIRIGALDGRHPELEQRAHERLRRALVPGGRLFIDGGAPLREVPLARQRARRATAARPSSRPHERSPMARYLISFPSVAMVVPDNEREAARRDAHAIIAEAKAAGVYVFAGGIDESVPPVLVSADGAVTPGGHPGGPALTGGFTVLELPSPGDAVAWAARIARACRCDQELHVFGEDPQS